MKVVLTMNLYMTCKETRRNWQSPHNVTTMVEKHMNGGAEPAPFPSRFMEIIQPFGSKLIIFVRGYFPTTVYILGQSALIACCQLNWFLGQLGRATCTVHLTSDQTSQKGIKCTKAKKQLYCLFYILCLGQSMASIAMEIPLIINNGTPVISLNSSGCLKAARATAPFLAAPKPPQVSYLKTLFISSIS